MLSYEERDECLAAAFHWRELADEERQKAKWNLDNGYDLSAPGQSVGDHRARLYEDVARSLELEAKTGEYHCATCLRPHQLDGEPCKRTRAEP